MLTVTNPYTQEKIAELEFATHAEIDDALEQSKRTFAVWRASSAHRRAELLEKVARLEERFDEFAGLIRDECGKPIQFAEAELTRSLDVFRWAAAEAQRFAGELLRLDVVASGRLGFGIHTRFPRGVILGITPYNWPVLLVAHKVAPAIACGCSIVIKPSLFTPSTAIKLAELFLECGAPKGLVQTVVADDSTTAELTRSPDIAMVSFTGSARVGKLIREQAADKPVALELGGNAWSIVMDDVPADLFPVISDRIARAGFGYAGQGCISVQNVAIARKHRDGFLTALRRATLATPFGDTRDRSVICGPVINEQASERIMRQLASASQGFEIVQSPDERGASARGSLAKIAGSLVIPPTLVVMGCLPTQSSLVQEEIFGPVVTALSFESLDTLIEQVNSSRYGLQTGVFTNDLRTIETLYRELNVGALVVNDVPSTRYDHQPYGEPKDSGVGREGVRYAMNEMTESKFLALSAQILGGPFLFQREVR